MHPIWGHVLTRDSGRQRAQLDVSNATKYFQGTPVTLRHVSIIYVVTDITTLKMLCSAWMHSPLQQKEVIDQWN